MRQKQLVAIEHPTKVNAPVDAIAKIHDLPIVAKALSHSEHTRKQQRSIDRRNFAIPTSRTALRIHPVIEPAALLKSARVKKTQGVARALERLRSVDPISVDGDAE